MRFFIRSLLKKGSFSSICTSLRPDNAGERVSRRCANGKLNFMRRGWEPPYPFGKSEKIVEAQNRLEAVEMVEIIRRSGVLSPRYKITASALKESGVYEWTLILNRAVNRTRHS
jgi:hypothetical protein